MSIQGEQILLRAYLQSADRTPFAPTAERLVRAARTANLAGATVLRGIMSYGSEGVLRQSTWSVVEHVPVIVEIVDRDDRIVAFVEEAASALMLNGLITLERAHVMMYRQRSQGESNKLVLGKRIAPLSTVPAIEARGNMKADENGILLRVFIGESDTHEKRPLYEVIVEKARSLGLAGATVLRGTEGFGANSVVHKTKLLEMSADLPVVIEIVDIEDKINLLLPELEMIVREGMITMEHVRVLVYRHDPSDASSSA